MRQHHQWLVNFHVLWKWHVVDITHAQLQVSI